MARSVLERLSNRALLEALSALLAHDRSHTVALLEHIGEVERRKLYVPAGYPSMYQYCIGELHMSEETSSKRIRAARAVARFPAVGAALAEGRVHLYGIALLGKYLNAHNVDTLLAAAEHRTGDQIRQLIAERFPTEDAPTRLVPIVASQAAEPSGCGFVAAASGTNEMSVLPSARTVVPTHSQEASPAMGPLRAEPPTYPRVTPSSPGRFALQVTLDQRTHDLLVRAQELLGSGSPAAEISRVLERALADLVEKLEHQRFAATDDPRARRSSGDGRYIPADIKREVAERDGQQCAFVGDNGHRCEERSNLEYDHIQPVARGGRTTVDNLRLLCRTHNQYLAERVYGEGFMRAKREAAGHHSELVRERAPAYAPVKRTKARASWRRGLRVSRLRTWRLLTLACAAARCRGRGSR